MAMVATGARKADLVIRNARLVNVCTAEIQEGIDVAVAEGRIALVGDAAGFGFHITCHTNHLSKSHSAIKQRFAVIGENRSGTS